jgi:hypothetical protein
VVPILRTPVLDQEQMGNPDEVEPLVRGVGESGRRTICLVDARAGFARLKRGLRPCNDHTIALDRGTCRSEGYLDDTRLQLP